MQARRETGAAPMGDISAAKWVSLSAAVARLSLAYERQFLRSIGRTALKRAPQRKKSRRKRRGARKPPSAAAKKRKSRRAPSARASARAVTHAGEATPQLMPLKAAA
jgi:hypothetical protein